MGIGSGLWFSIGFGVVYDVFSTGFSLVHTSLMFRKGFYLYAIVGGSGNSFLSMLFCWNSFQCFV